MTQSVSKENKKEFLKWLAKNFKFKRRESIWILDFLYKHDVILNKTHFVEYVKETPRGLYITTQGLDLPGFRFYKKGHEFKDPMQAFHEVRLNWSSPLYIQVNLHDAWAYPEYLSVLEENPYAQWNDMIPLNFKRAVNTAIDQQILLARQSQILADIDEALKNQEVDLFYELSQELNIIHEKMNALEE